MTKDQLRAALLAHVRQPDSKRNPGHSVVAIYLGQEEFYSLLDDRLVIGSIHPRGEGHVTFDGVPLYRVVDKNHIRIVSEYVDRV